MHTLAEINAALVSAGIDQADLTQIIADIKASVRASDAGVIAELEAKLATLPAITAERDAHAQTIADFLAADDAGKAKMLADAAKSADEKERDAAQAKLDAAQAEVIAAQAELTAAAEKVEAKK
jgi:hypothetical protein